jgi:hypothetical protein
MLLKGRTHDPDPQLLKKAFDYRVINDTLWIHRRDTYSPWIPEAKVLQVLQEVHDRDGYWAKTGTMPRVRGYYWPGKS